MLLVAIVVWEARRPPRHTAGYAVAKGLACDPGDLGLEYEEWMLDRGQGVRLPVWEFSGDRARDAIKQLLDHSDDEFIAFSAGALLKLKKGISSALF